MNTETDKFEAWAKVELFGHSVIVGKVSEATIGGCNFLRVDVPKVGDHQAYTKYYGNGAVYAMTPVSEEMAMRLFAIHRTEPINTYELRTLPDAEDATMDDDDDRGY